MSGCRLLSRSLCAALVGVVACSGNDTSTAPSPVPTPFGLRTPNPVASRPTPDVSRAVSVAVSRVAGATIRATGADGASYALVVPPNALPADTTITLTPLTGDAALPFAGGMAAGVQFAPDGLVLVVPAALTIVPARHLPANTRVALGTYTAGAELHLEPMGVDTTRIDLVVGHFSTAEVAIATPSEVQQLTTQHPPTRSVDQIRNEAASLQYSYTHGTVSFDTYHGSMRDLTAAMMDVIQKQLAASLDDYPQFYSTMETGLAVLHQVNGLGILTDVETTAYVQQLIQLFVQAFDRLKPALMTRCTSAFDYRAGRDLFYFNRFGEINGTPGLHVDLTALAPCLIGQIETLPHATRIDSGQTVTYSAVLRNSAGTPLTGTDSLVFSWSVEDTTVAVVTRPVPPNPEKPVPVYARQGDVKGVQFGVTPVRAVLQSGEVTVEAAGGTVVVNQARLLVGRGLVVDFDSDIDANLSSGSGFLGTFHSHVQALGVSLDTLPRDTSYTRFVGSSALDYLSFSRTQPQCTVTPGPLNALPSVFAVQAHVTRKVRELVVSPILAMEQFTLSCPEGSAVVQFGFFSLGYQELHPNPPETVTLDLVSGGRELGRKTFQRTVTTPDGTFTETTTFHLRMATGP